MVAPSGACFLSPRPSPKLYDCRQHTHSSSHALTSLASPTQTRVQACNPLLSQTGRRIVGACSALPSFGSGQPGEADNGSGNYSSNGEEEWIAHRTSGSSPHVGFNSKVDAAGGAVVGAPSNSSSSSSPAVAGHLQAQQQNVRRRLNLLPLSSPEAATAATPTVAMITTTNTVATCDVLGPRTPLAPTAEGAVDGDVSCAGLTQQQQQEQQGGGSGGGVRCRGSPLPYPWALPDEAEGCGGNVDVSCNGYAREGTASDPPTEGGPARGSELNLRLLPQLLAELCSNEPHCHSQRCGDQAAEEEQRSSSSSACWHSDREAVPADAMRPRAELPSSPPPLRQPLQQRTALQQLQQRALLLDQLHSGLAGGRLRPAEVLLVPGLLPFLTDAISGDVGRVSQQETGAIYRNNMDRCQVPEQGVSTAAGVALECLCTLLSEEALPSLTQRPEVQSELAAAVAAAVGVLRIARLPSPVNAPPHNSPLPPPQQEPLAAAAPSYSASSPRGSKGFTSPQSAASGDAASLLDGAGESYGWNADVSAAFFAASVLVRAAQVPVLAEAAVAVGGLGLLVRLMGCRPIMLAQMAVFATYKLVRYTPVPQAAMMLSGAAAEQAAARAGGLQAEDESAAGAAAAAAAWVAGMSQGQQQQQRSGGDVEREWRETALQAVAKCGGMGALCGCLEALEDRPSRDMASSLMMDMALVPQVPAIVAGLNQVQALVAVMSSHRCDHIGRMYALLVLARLCNHSAECQMDAVREGVLEPLLSLIGAPGDEERTHACRLLAILAQAVPTHSRIKASGVVQAVVPLLRGSARGSAAVVSEHAGSVLAVLAQNPDMHFHIVGCGAVPAMVPLLSHGTEKARTYVLASLMLLCEQEQRHASVVVRAGALPNLIAMVAAVEPRRNPIAAAAAAAAAPCLYPTVSPHIPSSLSSPSSSAPQRAVASTQEFAAAVLCSLSRYVDVQAELLSCGALAALVRCLGQGPPEAATNAAEALVHVTAGDAVAKRTIAADPAAAGVLLQLLSHPKPYARYWSLQLLRVISTDDGALRRLVRLSEPEGREDGELGDGEAGTGGRRPSSTRGDAVRRRAVEVAASFGLRLPALGSLTSDEVALRAERDHGGRTARAAALVVALVRLLRWPEGPLASWQQGRCRVLAGWLLARLCGVRECVPLLLAAGAVRELMAVLAEEQHRTDAAAATAAAAAGEYGIEWGKDLLGGGDMAQPPPPPLSLPGEGQAESEESGFEADEDEEGGAAPTERVGKSAWQRGPAPLLGSGGSSGRNEISSSSGGGGSYPRRMRFDINASAAAAAALLSVARTGRDGRLAVLSELALLHWIGTAVRLEGLDRL